MLSGILLGPGARIVTKTSSLFSESLQGMSSNLLDSAVRGCSSYFTEEEGEAAVDIGPCVPLYHQSCSLFNKTVFVLNYSVHAFPQSNLYSVRQSSIPSLLGGLGAPGHQARMVR